MPSIFTSTKEITNFPNKFISPFGDDPIVPIYSSIPFSNNQSNCLPCAICGNNSTRNKILKTQAEKFSNYNQSEINKSDISVGIAECLTQWIPDTSTVCQGQAFTQTRTNQCTSQQETRPAIGTAIPNWSAWSPSTSTVCLGTTFQQSRSDINGICSPQTQNATGTSAPNWSAWSPDASTIPCGQVFQQTRTDLNGKCDPQTQNSTGTNGCQTLSVLFARFD